MKDYGHVIRNHVHWTTTKSK